jgi:putative ABC transport system permease protein
MDWTARIRSALTVAGQPDDEGVIEELAQHARAEYERARADGCTLDEAEARVAAQIDRWRSEAATLRHRSRHAPPPAPPASTSSGAAGLAQDARYAWRLLRRLPGFAALVILTMALGIGATTSLFTVTYGVLMRPLPWPGEDRLVVLKETRGGRAPRFGSMSNASYLAWSERPATIAALGAWTIQNATLTGAGDPERLRVTAATASLFRVLEIKPSLGTLFDDKDEGTPVVVLSESLWRERFGGDPGAVGRLARLDGEPRTIVGVVPDAVGYPDRQTRAWIPYRVPLPAGNYLAMFEAVARLAPGATIAQASSEAAARGRFAANTGMTTMAIFGGDGPVEVAVRPLRDAVTGDVRRPLFVLLGAVGLLLVIATTNVASLQLARATTRRRELAIRAALGASNARTVRQLLIESLLLGVLGGAAGFAIALLLQRGAAAVLPADFPRLHEIWIDGRAGLFTMALSMAAGVLVGVLPAMRAGRVNLVAALADDGTSPVGLSGRSAVARSRLLIIGGQIAIACVLLVGASLLGRTFMALLHADRGFDPGLVLTTPISMPAPGYSPERRVAVLTDIVARLASTPGVRHVAAASEAPWMPGGSTSSLTLPAPDGGAPIAVQASPRLVSQDYFAALGLRLLAGRYFDGRDTETSQPVVVVNETFARRYLRDQPLEAVIPLAIIGRAQQGMAVVVGVVEDVRYVNTSVTTLPELYFSFQQVKVGLRSTTGTLLVRGDDRPQRLANVVRGAVRQADGTLAPGAIMTVQDRLLQTTLARPRLYAMLLGGFAAAALIVTGVGLFGVLSYTVAQRTRELGVRAALGARRGDIVALVLRQGLTIVLGGVAVGLLASLWLTRFVTTLLYGVTGHDGATYAIAAGVLLAVGVLACVVPAIRASRLDPLRALRA